MAVVESCDAGLAAQRLGATVLQLRAPRLDSRGLLEEAASLVSAASIPVLVSSRADVALAAGAAGVNLPEDDLPVSASRRLLGAGALVGRSVHSLEAARRAAAEGADYVLFGPVRRTPSHPGVAGRGFESLAEVAATVAIPVVAIGGLGRDSLDDCLAAGAAGFAAIRDFQA